MKPKLSIIAALLLALFASGCASQTTSSGGKETSILAGVVTISDNSFQPVNPATINMDTSTIIGRSGPSGNKVSVLWGMFTFHDF